MIIRRGPRDNSNTEERKRNLLKHYLLIIKEYGDLAPLLPKNHLYRLAGERACYKERTAGRYIREMLDDDIAVKQAMLMIKEELVM